MRSFEHLRTVAGRADVVLLAGAPMDYRLDFGRIFGPTAVIVAVNRTKHPLTINRYARVTQRFAPARLDLTPPMTALCDGAASSAAVGPM